MNQFIRKAFLIALALTVASCGGRQTQKDEDLALDEATAPADNSEAGAPAGSGGDEFSDFDEGKKSTPEKAEAAQAAPDDELSLEDPPPAQSAEAPPPAAEPPPEQAPPPVEPTPEPPAPVAETPPPAPEPAPVATAPEPAPAPTAPPASTGSVSTITAVKYKANDNGGTVVIEANGPISYTTRSNPELHQMVVEIPDSILPRKLQRPLNTRDIQGSIGAIDPYQNAGSNISRFVVQLREGAQEPVVQQEGNTILVVANAPVATKEEPPTDLTKGSTPVNVEMNDSQILSNQSLADFLAGNTKFYGKPISIEMNNMDVRDALRFMTEESGVNMVIADDVKGSVSLKLRQVPWDQALVVLMKTRRLGYSRHGNVLRIATQEQLKQEEDDATKLAQARRTVDPLKVRMFPISYAQVADLEKRVAGFLTERGKVVGDVRTNSLVVTDIAENIDRIGKLIASLDIQPPQVLIEGKIIEATDSFIRTVGVNWGFDGAEMKIAQTKNTPINMTPSLQINPFNTTGGALGFNLNIGRLDGLGNVDASLALQERDSKVKVISSPRILTLSNETANISQSTEVPIRQTTVNGNQTQFSYTFKPLVLKLEVTPQITADASIIMKVLVKREFRGATLDSTTEAFPVNSREANTRVLVKNGQTAVIGGIYQSDAAESETGVPYLREIPFLGALFRGRTSTKDKSELLIFLTPRVLAQADGGGKPATGTEF